MYSRKVGGRVLTFGVSGKLWRNALVMFDRETNSLWSHISGEAIDGALRGQRLQRVAATPSVKWKEWKRQHPDTKVLSVNGREEVTFDHYAQYHTSPDIGIHRQLLKDTRLPAKEQVIGIVVKDRAKAYPLSLFLQRSVIVDEVGGTRLIIFGDAFSGATAVYEATVEGQALTFPDDARGALVTDSEGTQWNLLSGVAKDGPHKGKPLTRLPHFQGYWFAWADFNRGTAVYGK